VKNVCEVFWWVFSIKIGNFTKGIMPKIFTELNLRRNYSNPHLNFEYLIKLVQIICAVVLFDRGQQYDPIAKRIN
jgi:hypothetical protein